MMHTRDRLKPQAARFAAVCLAGLLTALLTGCGGSAVPTTAVPAPAPAPETAATAPPSEPAVATSSNAPQTRRRICDPAPWDPADAPRYIMPARPPGPGGRVEQLPILLNSDEVQRRLGREYVRLAASFGANPPAGTAHFWILVQTSGELTEIELEASSGSESLDAAARRVVDAMEYRPAILGNCAVTAWIRLPVEFRMIRR